MTEAAADSPPPDPKAAHQDATRRFIASVEEQLHRFKLPPLQKLGLGWLSVPYTEPGVQQDKPLPPNAISKPRPLLRAAAVAAAVIAFGFFGWPALVAALPAIVPALPLPIFGAAALAAGAAVGGLTALGVDMRRWLWPPVVFAAGFALSLALLSVFGSVIVLPPLLIAVAGVASGLAFSGMAYMSVTGAADPRLEDTRRKLPKKLIQQFIDYTQQRHAIQQQLDDPNISPQQKAQLEQQMQALDAQNARLLNLDNDTLRDLAVEARARADRIDANAGKGGGFGPGWRWAIGIGLAIAVVAAAVVLFGGFTVIAGALAQVSGYIPALAAGADPSWAGLMLNAASEMGYAVMGPWTVMSTLFAGLKLFMPKGIGLAAGRLGFDTDIEQPWRKTNIFRPMSTALSWAGFVLALPFNLAIGYAWRLTAGAVGYVRDLRRDHFERSHPAEASASLRQVADIADFILESRRDATELNRQGEAIKSADTGQAASSGYVPPTADPAAGPGPQAGTPQANAGDGTTGGGPTQATWVTGPDGKLVMQWGPKPAAAGAAGGGM